MRKSLLRLPGIVATFVVVVFSTEAPIEKSSPTREFRYFLFNGADNSELDNASKWEAVTKEPATCETSNETASYVAVNPALTKPEFDKTIEDVDSLPDLLDRLLEHRSDVVIYTRASIRD